MGQLSAELNYERRLERYEEEAEELILNSENWEEELKHYLEEAGEERQEQKKEGLGGEFNEEHEDYSIMLVAANLLEDEKREGETHGEERHEMETYEGLVLLEKPKEEEEKSEEGVFPALEMGNYLRDLVVEGIEAPVEEFFEAERPESQAEEDVDKELSREEKRQEELGKEELFKEFTRLIETESERSLERLFERCEKLEEIEGPAEELGVYEKPIEEYKGPEEELKEDFELPGEEFVEHERPVEELKEEGVEKELIGESVEAVEKYGEFEREVVEYERAEEELEEVMGGFEEYERELGAPKEFEEVGEEVAEETEEAGAKGEGWRRRGGRSR